MFRKFTLTAATALALITGQAMAAEVETEITDYAFPFEGPFGSYDQMQLQRGLQVYTEICAACHAPMQSSTKCLTRACLTAKATSAQQPLRITSLPPACLLHRT